MSLLSILKIITNHPLNRDKKFKSVVGFAKWQIGSRLVPGAIVYDWVNGSKFLSRTHDHGLTGNIWMGLHEFPDMAFLLHALRPEDLFIDIGANFGSYTILACSAIGARCFAIEPVPSTFDKLVENIHLNHSEDRVTCLNIALGNDHGRLTFTSNMGTSNHALASGEQSDNTVDVEMSTLDTVLDGESPTMIKIDVEGFETPALEGAEETLKKPTLHSVILELNGNGSLYGYDESRIIEMMLDHGFGMYAYNPWDRTLVDLQEQNVNSDNTLFIRDKSLVLDKLNSAPKITVHGKSF